MSPGSILKYNKENFGFKRYYILVKLRFPEQDNFYDTIILQFDKDNTLFAMILDGCTDSTNPDLELIDKAQFLREVGTKNVPAY